MIEYKDLFGHVVKVDVTPSSNDKGVIIQLFKERRSDGFFFPTESVKQMITLMQEAIDTMEDGDE